MKEENQEKVDYSATLNLPKTDFPMRANLPENEPKIQEAVFEARHFSDPEQVPFQLRSGASPAGCPPASLAVRFPRQRVNRRK